MAALLIFSKLTTSASDVVFILPFFSCVSSFPLNLKNMTYSSCFPELVAAADGA